MPSVWPAQTLTSALHSDVLWVPGVCRRPSGHSGLKPGGGWLRPAHPASSLRPSRGSDPAWGLGVSVLVLYPAWAQPTPPCPQPKEQRPSKARRPRGQPSTAPASALSPFEHSVAFSITTRPPALWLPRTLDMNDHSSQPRAVPGGESLPEPDKAAFSEPTIPANHAGTVPSLSPAQNVAPAPAFPVPKSGGPNAPGSPSEM